PVGSVLLKELSLAGKRVETQLLARGTDGGWSGYSYAWNDTETEAILVPEAGGARQIGRDVWVFLPRIDGCLACHNSAAGVSLGLEVGQLNRTHQWDTVVAGQLETFEHIGLFDAPMPAVPTLAPPDDLGRPLADRARSYLHATCSECHRPGGPGRTAD